MATLNAMFRLIDGYSTQINKFIDKTNAAATKVLKASKNTDGYNDSLKRAGTAANAAGSGLTKLIGTAKVLESAKKIMDLTDTYTNTADRLKMINDETQMQAELQQKVFQAADRARGSYVDMASAVAKMNLFAGDNFTSNDEAIGFTELLQKSLKVSGSGTSEQQSAFLQLTQAMAAGRLQGDEFRSIMKNAPMVAQAIADYMGKTKEELNELSSNGEITANVIKSAMFSAASVINDKFATMPMTFADVWSKIKNAGMEAFGGVFEKISEVMNSLGVQQGLNNFIGAIYLAGDMTGKFVDFCVAAWSMASPYIWAAVVALGAYAIVQLISNGLALVSIFRTGLQAVGVGLFALAMWALGSATWASVTAELSLNSALYACPLVWIIGLILVLVATFYAGIAAVNHFSGSTISATGIIGGAIGIMVAEVCNFIILLWNFFADVANFIGNVFSNPVAAVKVLFYDMAITILGYMMKITKGIEDLINKIPGVTINLTGGLSDMLEKMKKDVGAIKDESGWKEYVEKKEYIDYSDAAKTGYKAGEKLENKLSNLFSTFKPENPFEDILSKENPFEDSLFKENPFEDNSFSPGNPGTVKGTGKGGAVKVENEEDIEWMRKLAVRDFVARIATNTLAPNIKIDFTGPITKEADVNGVAAHIGELLKEQIATAPEGVYP